MSSIQPVPLEHVAERLFLALALGLAIVACAALVLADVGALSPAGLSVTLAVAALLSGRWIVTTVRARRGPSEGPATVTPAAAAGRAWSPVAWLAPALMLAAWTFTPPFVATLWGGDATVYAGYGVRVGHRGAYVYEDPLLQSMSADRVFELFRNRAPEDQTGELARLPGGIAVVDAGQGTAAAGFAPLFPVLIAVASWLGGPGAAFWVSPVLALGGVAGLFFLVRSLAGDAAGAAAAAMLAVCLPQVWFARLAMSETTAQFFLVSGVWAAVLFLRTGDRSLAAASGLLSGTAGLAGFDVLVATSIALLAFVAVVWAGGSRVSGGCALLTAFAIPAAYGVGRLVLLPSNYEAFLERGLERLGVPAHVVDGVGAGAIAVVAMIALAAAAAVGLLAVRRLSRSSLDETRAAGLLTGLLLVGLFTAYSLPLRPRLAATSSWLVAYLSWPVVGCCVVVVATGWLRRSEAAAFRYDRALLTGFAAAALLVLYNPQLQDVDLHPATIRRFVPFVVPGISAVVAIGLRRASALVPFRFEGPAFALVVVSFIAALALPTARALRVTSWPDSSRQTETLRRALPPDAVVLVGPELAGSQVQGTLGLLYGIDAMVLPVSLERPATLALQIADWMAAGRPVYLLAGGDGPRFHAPETALDEVMSVSLGARLLHDLEAPPSRMFRHAVDVGVWRFVPAGRDRDTIDIGSYADDASLALNGFYGGESDGDRSYRWSAASSSLALPAAARVRLLVAGARPGDAPPAVVSVFAGDRRLVADLPLTDAPGWIEVDAGGGDPIRALRFEVATFNPAAAGLSDDRRDLGMRLYAIEVDRGR